MRWIWKYSRPSRFASEHFKLAPLLNLVQYDWRSEQQQTSVFYWHFVDSIQCNFQQFLITEYIQYIGTNRTKFNSNSTEKHWINKFCEVARWKCTWIKRNYEGIEQHTTGSFSVNFLLNWTSLNLNNTFLFLVWSDQTLSMMFRRPFIARDPTQTNSNINDPKQVNQKLVNIILF